MDPRLAGRMPRQDDPQMQAAKSSLLISLLKPQPKAPKLTSQTINDFHPLIVSVIKDTSPNCQEFVQCVARIVTYIVPSRIRTHALGDHLLKLINIFLQSSAPEITQQTHITLKMLHLIAAVFTCTANSSSSTIDQPNPATYFASSIAGHAVKFMNFAAPRRGLEAAPIHKQIHSLHRHWQESGVFTKNVRIKLREAARAAYDDWLSWLKANYVEHYENSSYLANGTHSHTRPSRAQFDDTWHSAPGSSIIPHVHGLMPIKTSEINCSTASCLPLDPELEAVVAQHVKDVAKIFAGPNAPRFSSGDDVTLNGLGRPITVRPSGTGKTKRKYSAYYGMIESCAKSFKSARKELPALVQVPEPFSKDYFPSRNVPPPMDDLRGYSGSHPPPPHSTGPTRGDYHTSFNAAYEGDSGASGWRGGGAGNGSNWNGDRGRGFAGRGGSIGNGGRSWGRGGGGGGGRGAWS